MTNTLISEIKEPLERSAGTTDQQNERPLELKEALDQIFGELETVHDAMRDVTLGKLGNLSVSAIRRLMDIWYLEMGDRKVLSALKENQKTLDRELAEVRERKSSTAAEMERINQDISAASRNRKQTEERLENASQRLETAEGAKHAFIEGKPWFFIAKRLKSHTDAVGALTTERRAIELELRTLTTLIDERKSRVSPESELMVENSEASALGQRLQKQIREATAELSKYEEAAGNFYRVISEKEKELPEEKLLESVREIQKILDTRDMDVPIQILRTSKWDIRAARKAAETISREKDSFRSKKDLLLGLELYALSGMDESAFLRAIEVFSYVNKALEGDEATSLKFLKMAKGDLAIAQMFVAIYKNALKKWRHSAQIVRDGIGIALGDEQKLHEHFSNAAELKDDVPLDESPFLKKCEVDPDALIREKARSQSKYSAFRRTGKYADAVRKIRASVEKAKSEVRSRLSVVREQIASQMLAIANGDLSRAKEYARFLKENTLCSPNLIGIWMQAIAMTGGNLQKAKEYVGAIPEFQKMFQNQRETRALQFIGIISGDWKRAERVGKIFLRLKKQLPRNDEETALRMLGAVAAYPKMRLLEISRSIQNQRQDMRRIMRGYPNAEDIRTDDFDCYFGDDNSLLLLIVIYSLLGDDDTARTRDFDAFFKQDVAEPAPVPDVSGVMGDVSLDVQQALTGDGVVPDIIGEDIPIADVETKVDMPDITVDIPDIAIDIPDIAVDIPDISISVDMPDVSGIADSFWGFGD